MYMSKFAYVTYVALKGILIFITYMATTCFLSHDADGAITDTI